jgi:hypothetical protein
MPLDGTIPQCIFPKKKKEEERQCGETLDKRRYDSLATLNNATYPNYYDLSNYTAANVCLSTLFAHYFNFNNVAFFSFLFFFLA